MNNQDRPNRQLSPESDPERWEALVTAIVDRARPGLERRRIAQQGVLRVIAGWRVPVLSVATGLAAAGLAVLLLRGGPEPPEPETVPILTEAVVHPSLAAWMSGQYEPDAMEIIAVFRSVTP
jgi:hypothetical protein